MDLKRILISHKNWIEGRLDGECADFTGEDLSGVSLQGLVLSGARMIRTNLNGANLQNVNICKAPLDGVYAIGVNFTGACLWDSSLDGADLRGSDFTNANLEGVDLRAANLSGVIGLIDPISFIEENFEVSSLGYIVYKVFNYNFEPPQYWSIEPNSVISEVTNFNRCDSCGCGINVASLKWVREHVPSDNTVWKCLIEWPWLAGVCVPYNTDGQIRASKIRLLNVI